MRHKSGDSHIERVIGSNVAKRRIARGLSQSALGKILEEPVTYQQVSKFESGTNRISASRLFNFAQIFECSVTDLLDGVGNHLPSSKETYDPIEMRLMRNFKNLTPNAQSAVGDFVHALGKEIAKKLTKGMDYGQ